MSVMFFFSSRRRHTSSKRDSSSDVCSSDLVTEDRRVERIGARGIEQRVLVAHLEQHVQHPLVDAGERSEERRVGKECRCRCAADPEKEKNATYTGGLILSKAVQ